MVVKIIYDMDKNVVNELKRNHVVDLVLESSLPSQSVCCSKSITNVVDK